MTPVPSYQIYTFHLDINNTNIELGFQTLCDRRVTQDTRVRRTPTAKKDLNSTYPAKSSIQPSKVFCPTCRHLWALVALDQANL